jgi:pyrroloquinoline quinone (PQQ) biosynthesis protein C
VEDCLQGDALGFRERLLAVMERKHHWAWPHFSGQMVTKEQLRIHFLQEYAVYVRDFPVFLARLHGMNPPQRIRTMLAENIYEEDTGALSVGRSHPALFLEMMEGLGFSPGDFEDAPMLPASKAYREWLDHVTCHPDWVVGVAVFTIFVEGSVHDRREILHPSSRKTAGDIERVVETHPLVRHHGVSPKAMDLIRAHQMVEAGHRHAAYDMVLGHAVTPDRQAAVLEALGRSLELWLGYRDGIAETCGLART